MLAFVVTLLQLLLVPPDRVAIPASRFVVGARGGEEDERPSVVTLSAFAIDRTEVTRAAYAACVLAGACATRPGLTIADLASRLPMTDVSQREASAYCRAVGARLPTEAQWERAARGGDERVYPWGDALDCTRANFGNFEGEGRCAKNPGRPVEVGGYPSGASKEGVLDLAGNVWEWTADYYAPYAGGRDPRGPRAAPRVAAESLDEAPRRAVRGGACCSMLGLPRATNRVGYPETYRDVDLGFRCAD